MRVLVLTAPIGDGHISAARALAADIRRLQGTAEVEVCDVLPVLPRPLRWITHDAYRWQLRAAPWLFGALFAALRRSRVLRWLTRTGLSLGGSRAMQRLVRRNPSDVIVSTWPPTTTILGCLRLRGKLEVPVCATVTDFAGLELWVDKGVDLHLVMHESLVPKVELLAGRGSAQQVSPLVADEFLRRRSRSEARQALGLPTDGAHVVVSGGGWGVGDMTGAIDAALHAVDGTVICLAGRDEAVRQRLESRFGEEPRVKVLGFSDRMSDLLAAADVLVHSTGGVTTLEALALGCPVVAFGAPSGHAPLVAREMAALGLVAHARTGSELKAAILAAPSRPRINLTAGVEAASLVLSISPRVVARLRARVARAAAMAVTVAALMFALMASDLTYPVVAEALALPESTSIPTDRQAVALVLQGRRGDLLALAPVARRLHLRLSAAVSDGLTARDVATLRRAGLDPIPELHARGVTSWFSASKQLNDQRARYHLGRSFYYLAPKDGFTLPDYLLCRELGGTPVQGQTFVPTSEGRAVSLRRGGILILNLRPSRRPRAALQMAIHAIARNGLRVSSVQRLAGESRGL